MLVQMLGRFWKRYYNEHLNLSCEMKEKKHVIGNSL